MKVLIINTLYHPYVRGGAEKSVQIIAEELVNFRVEVVVVSIGKYSNIEKINGIKVYYIKLRNLYWPFIEKTKIKAILNPIWHTIDSLNPLMASDVEKIIDLEKPDIVHTNNVQGFSVLVWKEIKNKDIPIVHTIRDYYLICPKTTMFHKGVSCNSQCFPCRIYSIPRIKFSDGVNYVVGISKFVVDKHIDLGVFNNAKTAVIPNSYPFKVLSEPTNNAPKVIYGYMGRIAPEKGIKLLLNTINKWKSNKYSLLIAGKGNSEYLNALKSYYSCDNTEYLGFVPAEELFQKIHVLVVPSIWEEPFGRTIIEAYAHGVPVIASKRGGIPDLVDDGITGYLFDPDKPEQLLSYMKRFVENPALVRVMRKSCLEKSKEFLPSRTATQYLKIYEELMHLKQEDI